MKRGLVLGGGGIVGMGYHAGALKALDDAGVDLTAYDVMVGTSAGAVMAAYLASGWSASDFYDYAHGRHPEARKDDAGERDEVREIFTPLWNTRTERLRRGLGSLYAIASSRGYLRGPLGAPLKRLRRAFPSGMYSTAGTRERLHRDLPETWPREDLFLCAADLYSGQRVPFGRSGSPAASFPDAVLAATAIPGVFPPVRIGDRHYVDGGIVSATSLDLAAEEGCEAILCVAPLGWRSEGLPITRDPKMWGPLLARSPFARTLRREVRAARAAGVEVLVLRPWLDELRALGTNSMRYYDRRAVVDAAREGAGRMLADAPDHPALAPLRPEARRAGI